MVTAQCTFVRQRLIQALSKMHERYHKKRSAAFKRLITLSLLDLLKTNVFFGHFLVWFGTMCIIIQSRFTMIIPRQMQPDSVQWGMPLKWRLTFLGPGKAGLFLYYLSACERKSSKKLFSCVFMKLHDIPSRCSIQYYWIHQPRYWWGKYDPC